MPSKKSKTKPAKEMNETPIIDGEQSDAPVREAPALTLDSLNHAICENNQRIDDLIELVGGELSNQMRVATVHKRIDRIVNAVSRSKSVKGL